MLTFTGLIVHRQIHPMKHIGQYTQPCGARKFWLTKCCSPLPVVKKAHAYRTIRRVNVGMKYGWVEEYLRTVPGIWGRTLDLKLGTHQAMTLAKHSRNNLNDIQNNDNEWPGSSVASALLSQSRFTQFKWEAWAQWNAYYQLYGGSSFTCTTKSHA